MNIDFPILKLNDPLLNLLRCVSAHSSRRNL